MASYSKILKFGNLADIVRTDHAESVFYSYEDKKDIGKKIFRELYSRFHNVEGEQKGFYMDDSKTIGILSQCQSLQALLLLASDFGLDFDDTTLLGANKTNLTIREIMDYVIEDVIDRIKTDTPFTYRFDASPYDTGKHFTVEHSNIEAITWVIPCFLQALKYHADQGETCKWERELTDVVSYGLNYLNRSFIDSENAGKSDQLEIGWNFTNDCEEPSLYYTFTVCECYVDLYETFRDYLSYLEAKRNGTLTEADEATFRKHLANYEKHIDDTPGLNAQGKQKCRFDPYNEMRLHYIAINRGADDLDPEKSVYAQLEAKCKKVAHEIWRLTKENLADSFFYNNLNTTLSESDISIATTSDALFNTVYIINIMLDAGLDEDIKLVMEQAQAKMEEDEEIDAAVSSRYEEAERDYNNLLEACQLASQKAFRVYEKLKAQGKEYIVEQFLVGFNETFIKHKEKVKELRKLRMRVFTLMPLLIRTNNVISEYLIKYPQVNMKKYLGYIMENRYAEINARGRSNYKWIWENDGYFSCSNYYYISALGEFYSYYEKYENKYIAIGSENAKIRESIESSYHEALRSSDGEIGQLLATIEEKDDAIRALQATVDAVETPVEDAVAGVVEKQVAKLLPTLLTTFLRDAAVGLTVSEIDDTEPTPEQEAFREAVQAFAFSMLSEIIYDKASEGLENEEDIKQIYKNTNINIKKAIKLFFKRFVSDAKNRGGNVAASPLIALFDANNMH